jgi:hypothetical protein
VWVDKPRRRISLVIRWSSGVILISGQHRLAELIISLAESNKTMSRIFLNYAPYLAALASQVTTMVAWAGGRGSQPGSNPSHRLKQLTRLLCVRPHHLLMVVSQSW